MLKYIEINIETGWILLYSDGNPYPINIRVISHVSPHFDNKSVVFRLDGNRLVVDHPYDEVVKYLKWMI